jgi:hypothetical protein
MDKALHTHKVHDSQSMFTWYKGDDSSNNFYICGIQEYPVIITQNNSQKPGLKVLVLSQ